MKIEVKYEYEKEPKDKSAAPKSIRNALVSFVILTVIVFLAGAGYTYYLDVHGKKVIINTPVVDATQQFKTLTPIAPDPNGSVGASVELITSPVARGALASASIKTYPGASCNIKVLYNKVASTEAGLTDKIADIYGIASWEWIIGNTAPEGSSPIHVTCTHHSKTGYVEGSILITAN